MEIYGEYVGRIKARRFVEVRARVEGYLEEMMFEEGKKVYKDQPLFMINQAQYKARADKADALLKKHTAQEAKGFPGTWNASARSTSSTRRASWTSTMPSPPTRAHMPR